MRLDPVMALYRLDEIERRNHSMFLPAEQRESSAYREFLAASNRAEFQMMEFRPVGKDGHDIWIEAF